MMRTQPEVMLSKICCVDNRLQVDVDSQLVWSRRDPSLENLWSQLLVEVVSFHDTGVSIDKIDSPMLLER